MIYEILQSAHRLSDSRWRLIFSLPISTFSTLGVSHVMRSINVQYLLTYFSPFTMEDASSLLKCIIKWRKGKQLLDRLSDDTSGILMFDLLVSWMTVCLTTTVSILMVSQNTRYCRSDNNLPPADLSLICIGWGHLGWCYDSIYTYSHPITFIFS